MSSAGPVKVAGPLHHHTKWLSYSFSLYSLTVVTITIAGDG